MISQLLDRVDAEARRATIGREQDFVAAARAKQSPRWPSCGLQCLGQRSHWIRAMSKPLPITKGHAGQSVIELRRLWSVHAS